MRTHLPILILIAGLTSCATQREADPPPQPPPTYSGPTFFRGTVGSVSLLEGYRPVTVSGYGIVVGLDGTGSPDVPPRLRQALLKLMSQRGVGQHQYGFNEVTPAALLDSESTAVVKVEGVIPPGATEGTRFDLLVTALPQTQTTSLEGGRLWTTELVAGGNNMNNPSGTAPASGYGPIFLNPFDERSDERAADSEDLRGDRTGRVLAGGLTNKDMPMRLVLNRSSYRLSRQVADRINSRIPIDPSDRSPVAEPQTASVIAIRVPKAYHDRPTHLLELIGRLYLNPTERFARQKAEQLIELLRDPANHEYADGIAYALQGLGRSVLDLVRGLYEHPDPVARLAALQAGARLGDVRAAEPLGEMARLGLGSSSVKAAELLGEMLVDRPGNVRAIRVLRELLDADDPMVRVAAYKGLAVVNDPAIERRAFQNKLEWVQVRCDDPMIYVSRDGKPRVVIFGQRLGFEVPMLLTMWDNRFMLRGSLGGESISLFYQEPNPMRRQQGRRGRSGGNHEPIRTEIPNNLGYLVGTMAFAPTPSADSIGLDLSYSQIVQALHRMTEEGFINAPFVLEPSDLTSRIASNRDADQRKPSRPETAASDASAATP